MSDRNSPDYVDELAESLRLAWKEIEVLKHWIEVLRTNHGDLERRVRQSWDKQGQTNTALRSDLDHHVHPTYITGPTGEPWFADAAKETSR